MYLYISLNLLFPLMDLTMANRDVKNINIVNFRLYRE